MNLSQEQESLLDLLRQIGRPITKSELNSLLQELWAHPMAGLVKKKLVHKEGADDGNPTYTLVGA